VWQQWYRKEGESKRKEEERGTRRKTVEEGGRGR